MASTPTIPTSFLPHQTAATRSTTENSDLAEAIIYFTYVVFGAVFVLAIGVFLYGHVLLLSKSTKDTKLSQAVAALQEKDVSSFARLHDRLTSVKTLMDNHKALSKFFPVIETVIPSTVRLLSLHISADEKDAATYKFTVDGVAKSFNALAVASDVFSKDEHLKNTLFAVKGLNKDGTVSFTLSGAIDSKTVAFLP